MKNRRHSERTMDLYKSEMKILNSKIGPWGLARTLLIIIPHYKRIIIIIIIMKNYYKESENKTAERSQNACSCNQ
jgi:hypothetical protein